MSLRLKLAIAMVVLAASATIAVGAVSYASTNRVLRNQIDRSLDDAASRVLDGRGPGLAEVAPTSGRGPGRDDEERQFSRILVQLVAADGTVVQPSYGGALPVDDRVLDIAANGRGEARGDLTVDGERYRTLTVGIDGGAIQFARSLAETERVLSDILWRTVAIVLVASLVALVLGLLIARRITERLERLTVAATRVAESGDLELPVPVDGTDEAGRLASAMSRMLESLAASKRAQQQLVQDAGHELRTPLTSLRTNVSVMRRFDELPPASREQLLDDLDSETRELTTMVNELVLLAADQRDDEPPTSVRLRDLCTSVVERAQRRSGRTITVTADDSVATVRPTSIERAVSNLVENALKFSTGDIDVDVVAGRIAVSDRGPGVPPTERDRIWARFHRADSARSVPGSGLGLAIVRDAAARHGGSVFVDDRPGGGAVIGFSVPLDPPTP
jgi:two-component system, OmpR family, sensor histidine kinase MprB